jgi:hypothetical protein
MEGMAQRSTRRDWENQITNRRSQARPADMDPIRELPYGPAACDGRIIEAGNTSAPDHALHSPSRFFLHQRSRPNTFVSSCLGGTFWPNSDIRKTSNYPALPNGDRSGRRHRLFGDRPRNRHARPSARILRRQSRKRR